LNQLKVQTRIITLRIIIKNPIIIRIFLAVGKV
jgi:hypothetical protein